jgi:ABC-2 type transport system permease protein
MSTCIEVAVCFPMLFLSNATIPYKLFPSGMQKVAAFLSLTQGIKLMKEVSMGVKEGERLC